MNIVTKCTILLEISKELGMINPLMVIVSAILTLGTELPTIFIISEAFRDQCQNQHIIIRVVLPYQHEEEGYNTEMPIHLTPYTMNQNATTVITLDTWLQNAI